MKDRFTRISRVGRGKIPKKMRLEVFERDNFTCQFCHKEFPSEELTIDHLIPISLGGLDEITNFVSCCEPCNRKKSNQPLSVFAKAINIAVSELPIHGDPVIDNKELPLQIRILRKNIFQKVRAGKLRAKGKQAQKKIEKEYRRGFWETPEGKQLEELFPNLPGQVRIMIPEIKTIAKTKREYFLLLELAKSARTRNLIGTVLEKGSNVEERLQNFIEKTKDSSLKKRAEDAIKRFNKNFTGEQNA